MLAAQFGAWLIRTDWPADYLVWFRDRWDVVEIKRPDKQGWASEYTPKQIIFRAEAQRRGARLVTWHTRDDVMRYTGAQVTA